MYKLDSAATKAITNAVLVTGGARSGTTILGKLIHTYRNVEYAFEPPMLIALFSIINKVPAESWRFLYEAYLGEDFFINALAGRSINTNRSDDSSIYAVKTADEVERRLGRSWSRKEIMERLRSTVVAYKIPNIVPYIGRLLVIMPHTRVIVIRRGAVATFHSLMEKGWFKDHGVQSTAFWPFREVAGKQVPYWVRDGEESLWVELPELERCAYYYLLMSDLHTQGPQIMKMRYSELLADPIAASARLAGWLGLDEGERTRELLATIRPNGKPLDESILSRLSVNYRDSVREQSALSE